MWLGDWDVEAAGASGFWMPQAAGSRAPHPVSTPWERMKVEAVEAYEFKDLERKGPTSTILSISLSLSAVASGGRGSSRALLFLLSEALT